MQWINAILQALTNSRTGISWQDNAHCVLRCWSCTADWLYASQTDNYRSLLCWLTMQTACCS